MERRYHLLVLIVGLHCLLLGCGGRTVSPTAKELENIRRKLDEVLTRLGGAPGMPSSDSSVSRRLDELLKRLPEASKNADAELAAVDALIKAGEMQQAYDALLAAMRIAPDDQKVFEASLKFVKAAGHDGNDDSMSLALDIHQRAANLIPYLPLGSLQDAHSRHAALGDELFGTAPADANYDDPLAEAESLLACAGQPDLPSFAKALLLNEVQAELGVQARRFATSDMSREDAETFWKRWKAIKDRYEQVQTDVLAIVYEEDFRPRLRSWSNKLDEFYARQKNISLDEIPQANDEIVVLLDEGQRISREIASYLEAGVEAAKKDNQEHGLEKHLARLERLQEWNYNRWALGHVEKVEQSEEKDLEKLKSLSAIDQSRLAPFVWSRFSEVWKELFDECSEDEQVEATKFYILREFQP